VGHLDVNTVPAIEDDRTPVADEWLTLTAHERRVTVDA
jgi:hypothetical protein